MRRLWLTFTAVIVVSFAVLGWLGVRIYQQAPPVPSNVVAGDGAIVIPPGDIEAGQNGWQSMGGMEVGSIWGHGSYVAPDWTADWLHREARFVLDEWARGSGGDTYGALSREQQAALEARLEHVMRTNTCDAGTGRLTIDPSRARAFAANASHFADVFTRGRPEYAIPPGTLTDPAKLRQLSAFFFWTSWAASTNRPGDTVTYTSNWPHEPLVGNAPTGDAVVWTGVSIILLLAGIGAMVWYHASRPDAAAPGAVPTGDPLLGYQATPSQLATINYFWTVAGLLVLQIAMGVIVAHYGVEGGAFYGIPIASILPYSVARTWHLQLGIFWSR